jgi:hypothetical protein
MQKEDSKDKQTQLDAGATLLNEPIRFKIPFIFGIKLSLGIRPLHPGTIVKISQQETRLKDVSESDNMIHELMKSGSNLRVFCRIVAIGILNNPVKISLFTGYLTRLLMWKVESTSELFTLNAIVYRQMGAEHFFFIMQLTKGMNFLKKRTTPESIGEANPSGEPSP